MRARPWASVITRVSRTVAPCATSTATKRTGTPEIPRESDPFTRATKSAPRESPATPTCASPESAVMITGLGAIVMELVSAIPVGVSPTISAVPRAVPATTRPAPLTLATVVSELVQLR